MTLSPIHLIEILIVGSVMALGVGVIFGALISAIGHLVCGPEWDEDWREQESRVSRFHLKGRHGQEV